MKVVVFMAMSLNGYIARPNDATDFVTAADWKNFTAKRKQVGNLIVGKRTYDVMLRGNEFENFGNAAVVAVTGKKSFRTKKRNHFCAATPKKAIELLKHLGFKTALVAGGGKLNSSFLKKKLVDEIFVDVEPIVLGRGIPIFSAKKFEVKLRLLGTKRFSKNEMQLHYKVLKK